MRTWLRRQSPGILALLAGTLVAGAGFADDDIYTWTEDGQVRFSDRPPPGTDAKPVKIRSSDKPDAGKKLQDLRKQFSDENEAREERKAEMLAAKEEAERVAEHCRKSRDSLSKLQTSTRRQYVNESGELAFLTEDMRQEWIKKAQAEIDKHCK